MKLRLIRDLFSCHSPRRRRFNSTVTADASHLLESRMLLSGAAIYPQPASSTPVALAGSSQSDDSSPDDSRIGTQDSSDVFKTKIKYTVSNSGPSPLEIDVTTLHDRDGDGFAKVYSSKIPAQKTKRFAVKVYALYLVPESFAVDLRNGNQVLMNDIRFTVQAGTTSSLEGEKWGVKMFENQQLDIAYLNGQVVWAVNPFNK